MLEQGPDWQNGDLISSEIWGRRLKAVNPAILEGKDRLGYSYNAGWGSGGAATHYFAMFPRLLPSDFNMKSAYGRGLDWPFGYDDLAPYYDRVAQDIGVSGDAKAEERWRPPGQPYPMPPIRSFRHGDVWLKGFEALGIKTARATTAINSQDYKGRPACVYDGWCNAGCPIGALANPSFTYLAEARQHGAEVRPFSTVTRVLTNDKGRSRYRHRVLRPRQSSGRSRKRASSSWRRSSPRIRASFSIRRPTSTPMDWPMPTGWSAAT